jgi:hypothetical protein
VQTIFGVEWAELKLSDVETFLADAGDEALTWEAKADGDQRLHPGSIRKAVCAFANSDLGGYLILGAKRTDGAWRLVGLTQPSGELSTWVTNIAAQVRPTPNVDVKTWPPTGERGPVAVVWIPNVAESPAMTSDGAVFQRVSGSSLPVTEPSVLAGLFTKGNAARGLAEQLANRAITNMIDEERTRLDHVYAAFGFAAIGGPPDRSAVLFTSAMLAKIERAAGQAGGLGSGMASGGWFKRPPRAAIDQDSVSALAEVHDGRVTDVIVGWDGSVGIIYILGKAAEQPLRGVATSDVVKRAWTAGLDVLAAYGATGHVHVALLTWDRAPDDPVALQRWTEVRPPTDEELASVRRELERAMGLDSLEG